MLNTMTTPQKHTDHAKLKQMAALVNRLAREADTTRTEFYIAVANAMDMVREEGLVFKTWARQNLRKPDGTPWGDAALTSYAHLGRDPERVKLYRKANKKNRVEASLRYIKAAREAKPKLVSGDELERQIQALMFAWESACSEARTLFLRKIQRIN